MSMDRVSVWDMVRWSLRFMRLSADGILICYMMIWAPYSRIGFIWKLLPDTRWSEHVSECNSVLVVKLYHGNCCCY